MCEIIGKCVCVRVCVCVCVWNRNLEITARHSDFLLLKQYDKVL